MQRKKQQQGFALLLTLVIASVVLAIGLSLLSTTLKQFTLSAVARNSEIAFHVADSGLDCLSYYNIADTSVRKDFLDGSPAQSSVDCGGVTASEYDASHDTDGDDGLVDIYHYTYTFDTPNNSPNPTAVETLCNVVSVYIADASGSATGLDDTYTIDGEGFDKLSSCPANGICTTIFSRGYNRPCEDRNSIYTVQRELNAQF